MASTSTTNIVAVQSILQQWKNFDLTSLQKELDETAAELANRQDESENSRKKLVDQSREFKKNTPEEVRKQVTPLLKSFQAEIDFLSKRSKASEGSFLALYKKIIEAPDPVPAMEQLSQTQKKAQRSAELEAENKNLRLTLDQYNAEFAEVRNQEVTIRQLKERIKYLEEQSDSLVQTRVAEQETATKRYYEERERESRHENESLSQKLKEAEQRADALQTSLNAAQSELFVLRSRGDDVGSAKASELELILLDVERANQRADSAEKECELLREKVKSFEEADDNFRRNAATTNADDDDDSANIEGDGGESIAKANKAASREVELAAKDKQIDQFLEELKQVNGKFIESEKRHQSERIELSQQLEITQRRLESAEDALKTQADYDEIKRELNVLKSIELGQQHENDEDEEDISSSYGVDVNTAALGGAGGGGKKQSSSLSHKPLEVLLLEKNKAVQEENALLRNNNRQLNVQQAAPTTASSSSFYRDISDDQLTALIATVSRLPSSSSGDRQDIGADSEPAQAGVGFGGANSGGHNDHHHRRKKDLSSPNKAPGGSGNAPPLQNVVKRMACLIGSELVAMYQASEEQQSANVSCFSSENNNDFNPMSDNPTNSFNNPPDSSTEKTSSLSIAAAADPISSMATDSNSPIDPAMTAMAMDLFASMRTPTPAGFEEALASGVPREIVEYVALHHLQQLVAKQVRESAASGEILDTAEVAQRCRIALSTHNIGQRLLAKCILNQSQGSVSELLSKPKPWEKLTEKGKESFRRITAWLSDDSSVELLRMISPKRAYGGFRERYPSKQETTLTQEKLNAILSEAQNAQSDPDNHISSSDIGGMESPADPISPNNSASLMTQLARDNSYSPEPDQMATMTTPNSMAEFHGGGGGSPSKNAAASSSSVNRSSGRYRHDDIPKEMIYEIYRREVEKLQAQGNVAASSTEDVKPNVAKLTSSSTKDAAQYPHQQKRFPQISLTSGGGQHHSAIALPHQQHSSSSGGGARRRLDTKRLSGLGLSFIQRRTTPNQQSTGSLVRNNQLLSIRNRSLFANNRRAENRAGMRLPPVRASWSMNSKPKSSSHLSSVGGAGRGAIGDDPSASLFSATAITSTPTNVNNNHSSTMFGASSSPSKSMMAASSNANSSPPEEHVPQSFSPGGTPIVGTRAFKAILPPISQELFEEYNNMDTEDLVRRVKDYLTKYSISQRLFGEQVLGLSQGSVSDLLARPKLWSMLTQKGREPFIRMQLFLNDNKALQKLLEKRQQQLQAQQNGTGGDDFVESIIQDEGSSEFAMSASQAAASLSLLPTQVVTTAGATPSSAASGSGNRPRNRRKPAMPRISLSAARDGGSNRPRELSGIAALLQVAIRGGTGTTGGGGDIKSNRASIAGAFASGRNLGSGGGGSGGSHARRHVASAIPEPSEPIDTKSIVAQVKALLLTHNIGQKVFGATILDMSQGAVSDLLSKTKPWELLSARGREAILRMKAWLDDPNRLEKIQQLRHLVPPRAPSMKRPAPADTTALPSVTSPGGDFYSSHANNSRDHDHDHDQDAISAVLSRATGPKKARLVLLDEQKEILKSAYDEDAYPSSETVTTLARQLGLSIRTVINWFHNRRMRSQQHPAVGGGGGSETGSVAGGTGSGVGGGSSFNNVTAVNDGASDDDDDGVDPTAYGASAEEGQFFTYEDELAFAHAELERMATEEDFRTGGSGSGSGAGGNGGECSSSGAGVDWSAAGMSGGGMDDQYEEGNSNDDYDYGDSNNIRRGKSERSSAEYEQDRHGGAAAVAKPRVSLLERLEQYVKREEPSWDAEEPGRTEAIARLERSINNEDNTEWEF